MSLANISGSCIIKNNINNKITDNSGYNFVLFQMWESIKYAGQLMPLKIKREAVAIERGILKTNQYDADSSEEKILIEKVNQLFITLSQRCNTQQFFGDIIPTTEILYFHLGQIWADRALSVLWKQIGRQIDLPNLMKPEEKRAWLEAPQNAHQLGQVNTLNLSTKGLKIFPSEIAFCNGLQVLNLAHNEIVEIPILDNLPLLTHLYLEDNQISSIPARNLPLLTHLSLDNNQISSIPDWNLPLLTHLYLEDNQISSIPDWNLPPLTHLSLSKNQISSIPAWNLPLLTHLYLEDNQISSIPDWNLPLLDILSLNNNQISSLQGLNNSPLLQRLHLENNQISSLQGLNNSPLLQRLSLNNNQISSLQGLNNSPRLEWLFLKNNQISSLQGLNNLPLLDILCLDNNQIPIFSDLSNLPLLSHISLNNNILLFISDRDQTFLHKEYCVSLLNQFRGYNCKSKLAQFFQWIGVSELDTESVKKLFYGLEKEDQYLVFEMVYQVAGITSTDLLWGEHHTFDDMNLFYKAIRKAVSLKFDRLPLHDKNRVYKEIPDKKRGENHPFDHLLKFIDAISSHP